RTRSTPSGPWRPRPRSAGSTLHVSRSDRGRCGTAAADISSTRSAPTCTTIPSARSSSAGRSWPPCSPIRPAAAGDLRARLRRFGRHPCEPPHRRAGARRRAARGRERGGIESGEPAGGEDRAEGRLGGARVPRWTRRPAWRAGRGTVFRRRGGSRRRPATARPRGDHQTVRGARSAHRCAPAGARDTSHPPGGSMNALTPYAAFFMRLAVGLVFLQPGGYKFHHIGIPGVAGMLHGIGFPFATIFAVILIAVETIGAICVVIGFYTRFWAACMAIEMLVAILAVQLPKGGGFEVEGLLFAGAITLIALGDGPLSIAVKLKHGT